MVRPPVHWSCSVMEHRRAQPGMAVLEEGGVKPPLYEEGASFVAPLGGVDVVEVEGLFGEGGRIIGAGVFPGGDVGEIGVVAEGFAFWGLVFLAEMADASGFFKRLIEFFAGAKDADFLPELFAQRRDQREGFFEAGIVASHA